MHENRSKKTIQSTYDKLAARYDGTTEDDELSPEYEDLFAVLARAWPEGGRALDLGCGDGRRFTQRLARQFEVVGIDFSPAQIEAAKRAVPEATFLCEDIMAFEAAPDSFECVLCLYALFHLPLKEQRYLIQRMSEWLVPGGCAVLLFNNQATGGQDIEEDWCGGPMRWFHYSRSDYETMLADVGIHEVMGFTEDDAEPDAWRVAVYRKA